MIGLLGFLTPPLLGLAGAYLVLAGLAWSLLWVVIVLLFVACVKTRDWFTTVIVLPLGAGLGWLPYGVIPIYRPVLPWHWYGSYCLELSVVQPGRIAAIPERPTPVPAPASRRRHRTSLPGHWDSLSCGSWQFWRCGSEAAGCSGSECRSNPITERRSVHIATAVAAPARPPTLPGGSNGIPCARFVRMGMPRRVNRAEETS